MKKDNSEIKVPKYDAEYGKVQKRFYKEWVKSWKKGKALNIEGQYGYLFIYLHSLIKKAPPQTIINELENLKSNYPVTKIRGSESFYAYCNLYMSDSYIWLGNIHEAIATLYESLQSTSYAFLNNQLSLKHYVGEDISGREVLSFTRAKTKLTTFGRKNLSGVEGCIDLILEKEREGLGKTVLEHWLVDYEMPKGWANPTKKIHLLKDRKISKIPNYYIENLPIYESIYTWVRDSENMFREQKNVPRIGEGWVSETELYYKIKEAFPNLEVIPHASPKWLSRQHLDIYLPKLRVAIEYQGKQHNEPVAFFGGEAAFEKTKERDERKKLLCHKNNIQLIYVYPDYEFNDVLDQINQ